MNLSPLSTKNKRATINDTTVFNIIDEVAFGRFAGQMITAQNFTWRLESENLHVQALKFPLSKGIKFKKDVTLNGNELLGCIHYIADWCIMHYDRIQQFLWQCRSQGLQASK